MKNTKLRFTLTLIGLVVVVAGFMKIFGDRNQISTAPQEKTIETPEATESLDSTPQRSLGENEEFVAPAKLYITVPEGLSYREETAGDPARATTVGFYIDGESEGNPYELYGVYQDKDFTEEGFKQAQQEMEPDSIQDMIVGGYKGVEGLVTGPKGRYLTLILKDGKLISFSTIPATEENKAITEQILSTVSFDE